MADSCFSIAKGLTLRSMPRFTKARRITGSAWGAFFFDAAVSEDSRAGWDPARNPSPSFHFILIDGGQPNQAAQLLVKSMQRQVEAQIHQYNQRGACHPSCPSLDIGVVRDHFLRPGKKKKKPQARADVAGSHNSAV